MMPLNAISALAASSRTPSESSASCQYRRTRSVTSKLRSICPSRSTLRSAHFSLVRKIRDRAWCAPEWPSSKLCTRRQAASAASASSKISSQSTASSSAMPSFAASSQPRSSQTPKAASNFARKSGTRSKSLPNMSRRMRFPASAGSSIRRRADAA